jgi:hypothetical protein
MAFITTMVMVLVMVSVPGDALFREASGSQVNQRSGDSSPVSLSQEQSSAPSPLRQSNTTGTRSIGNPHCILAMPRIRGKPRRGAAWYAAASRRKRKAQFEAAMAIVTRRRRHSSRRSTRPRTPPMAYVEEVAPEEGPPSPPVKVFSPPENWQSSTGLDPHSTQQPAETYSPCYIIEEIPPEFNIHGETTGGASQENKPATDETKASEDTDSRDQPSAANWGYLDLVFGIRDKLEDLDFRLGRMDQRLDMFFAAHSRASAKKQCPTCARPYSFPARWRHSEV